VTGKVARKDGIEKLESWNNVSKSFNCQTSGVTAKRNLTAPLRFLRCLFGDRKLAAKFLD